MEKVLKGQTVNLLNFNRCYSVFFSNPTAPHQDSPIQFSKRPSRIGKPCFDFRSPRPASGQLFYFSLALSHIGTAIFIFHWHLPASGQPFLFFVDTFPYRVSKFQSQNYGKNNPIHSHHKHFSAKIT